jgi:mannan endo-1,4-beta-mannosidase
MKLVPRLAAGLLLAGLCNLAIVAPGLAAPSEDFVTVKDTHFKRNGKLYYITGTNMWYAGYLGAASGVGDRARLVKELDNLKAIGVNNIRLLAVSEATKMRSGVKPVTTTAPGQYDENLLAGMDFLLSEMAKRDMTAVIYLNNFWQWSGGMTQYVNWFTGAPAIDPNDSKDYESFIANSAKFYQIDKAQAEYRSVIRKVVERVNTITGKPYRDDPTIMSWQLANEPRPGNTKTTEAEKEIYVRWIDDTARFIRSMDKNHLVSTGSEGLAGSVQDSKLFIKAHQTKNIDYLTYHMWPKNWFWFDSTRPAETWAGMMEKSDRYLNVHIDLAKQLKKPIVLEEFGLDRDGPSFARTATTKVRDRFYGVVFDVVYRRAAKGDPIAGWNFWAWGGMGRAANPNYWWKEGNDFMGDPPQEEQGLYSVFDSDVSSLMLIKQHADKLKTLQK